MPDGHLTLRQRCEEAARVEINRMATGPLARYSCENVLAQDRDELTLASAIERVSREFAERAIREYGSLAKRGYDSHDDGLVDAAIEAAARGEDE